MAGGGAGEANPKDEPTNPDEEAHPLAPQTLNKVASLLSKKKEGVLFKMSKR